VAPPVPDREAHPLLGQSVFAVFRERRVASANPVYAVIGKGGKMVLLLWVEHHAHTTTSGLRESDRLFIRCALAASSLMVEFCWAAMNLALS
jgi:hypothetical protein